MFCGISLFLPSSNVKIVATATSFEAGKIQYTHLQNAFFITIRIDNLAHMLIPFFRPVLAVF